VAKKAETKQIKTVADLVGEKVTVRVTDGNRVTEETTFIGVVLAVMEYGVLINYPRRGALISDVLPWTHIVQLSHRAPDPEPDPEPEDEGSAVGEEDEDEDEVYTGEEDDDNDEDFYGVDEDFGGDDDED
jgi:hypothetical protein